MLTTLILVIISGAIIGALGRAVLPGAQDIGWAKTIGLGVISSFIVGLIFGSWTHWVISLILAIVVAAGLLWLAIRQGWVKPTPAA